MSQFETIEVLELVESSEFRIPTKISIELQVKIRDDDSRTRPFVKIKIEAGSRSLYCNPEEAKWYAAELGEMVKKAEAKISQLRAEYEAEQEAARAERTGGRNGDKKKVFKRTGATARRREKERSGKIKTYDQRKKAKSEDSADIRDEMKHNKGKK